MGKEEQQQQQQQQWIEAGEKLHVSMGEKERELENEKRDLDRSCFSCS